MIAAIRAIAEHIADELGKPALDERVLRAMAKVPRHEFVPIEVQSYAYLNRPISIGFDKTISQPLMVAVMTDLLELKPTGQADRDHHPSASLELIDQGRRDQVRRCRHHHFVEW